MPKFLLSQSLPYFFVLFSYLKCFLFQECEKNFYRLDTSKPELWMDGSVASIATTKSTWDLLKFTEKTKASKTEVCFNVCLNDILWISSFGGNWNNVIWLDQVFLVMLLCSLGNAIIVMDSLHTESISFCTWKNMCQKLRNITWSAVVFFLYIFIFCFSGWCNS